MIEDLFNTTCTVYRLNGYPTHDYSVSDEGEVDEVWDTIDTDIPCRKEYANVSAFRRSYGMLDTGIRRFYTGCDANIQNADRLAIEGILYRVNSIETIYGYTSDPHHKEGIIEVIDWNFS